MDFDGLCVLLLFIVCGMEILVHSSIRPSNRPPPPTTYTHIYTAAAPAPGKITLEAVPAPADANKDPHAPPPGTYFERNRPNNGNGGRVLSEGSSTTAPAGTLRVAVG